MTEAINETQLSQLSRVQRRRTRRATIDFTSSLALRIIVFRPYANAEFHGPTSPQNPTVSFNVGPEDSWYVIAVNIATSDMLTLVGDLIFNNVERLILGKGALGATELALLNNVPSLDELSLSGDWQSLAGMQSLTQIRKLVTNQGSNFDDAELANLSGLSQLQTLVFNSIPTITNAGMLNLATMEGLQSITLNRTSVDQNGVGVLLGGAGEIRSLFMEQLAVSDDLIHLLTAHPMLELDFDETDISDVGVAQLFAISSLIHLDLKDIKGSPIQDITMNTLLRNLNQLQFLSVTSSAVTDDGLGNLSGLPLIELDLHSTGLTDGIIPTIGTLTTLRSLLLGETAITDTETDQFTNLTDLRELFLNDTAITDNTLPHLYQLNYLNYVNLENTQVTASGVANLQAALPDATIHWQ